MRRSCMLGGSLAVLVLLLGCGGSSEPAAPSKAEESEAPPSEADVHGAEATEKGRAVPDPDLSQMEPQVAERFEETLAAVAANPGSAAAWGDLGKVAHAHELWPEAIVAYEEALGLDPTDARWPYFLGDVRSVVGTDLPGAANALRMAIRLRPGYAPAHMRLGRVLVADDQPEAAAAELEKALELAPGLQPALVTLAQIELSRGELEQAEVRLEQVLAEWPGHAQALSTLGQVYLRQGRRDEARAVAERARDSALYNLFDDPLMGEVVREGRSSVLIWERAKGFFEKGDFEQAAIGLSRVVGLRPDNVEARYQLALALGELGQLERSLAEMEKVVAAGAGSGELDPSTAAEDADAVGATLLDAQVQVGRLYLELGRPASAVAPLRRVLEQAPDDPDAGWLLGRAELATGAVHSAVATFERAAERARTSQQPMPTWAHNEWGAALAQTGQLQRASGHFEQALAADPNDAQALFYLGLIYEGTGQLERAVEYYCRSLRSQPNPPASDRLAQLGRDCTQ